MAAIVRVGPWGGEGGNPWDDGVYSGIHQIRVCYRTDTIGFIRIEYDNNGILVWSEEHGVNLGNSGRQIEFHLDANEILTSISGFHDTYIRRLACESDLCRYGPYGSQRKNNFESHPKGDWKIVGFHGRSDPYLRAIGVYLKNLNAWDCSPPFGPSGGDGGDSSHAVKLISVGPWGGDGGDTWDDVLYSGIHKIRVGYDRGAIVSIHIEYDNNGSTVWKEHGGSHHDEEVELDYPQEILTSISGYYDTYLRSLTFESNLKKKYGPYGSEEGTCFSFPISDGKIVSFHGRSDEYLRSIGVYYLSNLHAAVPPLKYPREGEPALMVGESVYARASQATREGKKEEGSRAREEEDTRAFDLEPARQARPAGKKEEEKAERKKEEESSASEEEEESSASEEEDTGAFEPSSKTIVFGQLEGEVGYKWDDDRVYSGIRQIIVVYGDAIDSINVEYDNNESPFWLELGVSAGNNPIPLKPGVRAGNKIGKIRLHYQHEILTSISGHYDTYLMSLTFKSTLKKYGPYGREQGTYFSFPISDGKIVGFHGRSGSYLDFQDRRVSRFYCIGVSLSFFPKSVKPISVGPWGSEGGDMWDDGVYSGIRQIIVVHDQEAGAITSIDIQYDNNGSLFWLEHGGNTGNKIEKIQLEYPNESLTSISGRYDTYGIRRLTFKSNLREYGPYGIQPGTHDFSSPNGDVKIVGFHGWSDEYLCSIGVYYLPNLHTGVSSEEYPGEGEPEGSRAQEENTRAFDLESPREGEAALIVGESLHGSARQARRAGKKEEEKAERKKEEGSRASEEEEGSNASEEEEEGSSASEEEEDTRAFEPEYPGEGEPEGSRAQEENTRAFDLGYRLKGEDAIIVEGSSAGSAKKAQELAEKEAEGSSRDLSSLHI